MTEKGTLQHLAIFGGSPAFEEPLHVGKPNVGNRQAFLSRVNDILDRRWFTNHGKYVQEFEQRIAERIGTRHCIAVCNATIALEFAVRGLGMSGEGIIPSFTFVATAHSLQWQGITPVVCDVDPRTHNLSRTGTAGVVKFVNRDSIHSMPTRNHRLGTMATADAIGGQHIAALGEQREDLALCLRD